jgi:protein subunit release factor A
VDIDAKDCRLDGFRGAGDFYWLRATHLPTGVTVETRSSGGPEGRRRLMEKLEASVKRHMNAEAEVPEEEPRCLVYSRLRASETRGSLISFQDARARRQVRESVA